MSPNYIMMTPPPIMGTHRTTSSSMGQRSSFCEVSRGWQPNLTSLCSLSKLAFSSAFGEGGLEKVGCGRGSDVGSASHTQILPVRASHTTLPHSRSPT